MANNKEIAHQILTAVGGASNLKDATHCMTRLRLYLKDDSIPKDEEVKAIGGVLGVVRGGQQYQVIIGTNVPKVYEELCKLANLTANAPVEDAKAAAEDAAVAKPKLTPQTGGQEHHGLHGGLHDPTDSRVAGGRAVPLHQLPVRAGTAGTVSGGKRPVHPV